ncbi:outer membrane channel protein TolC, partial [Vibrio parahaemolyticus]|nr:outer membrane channel protein TolC [Vibrio parahaemolyticus]
YDQVLADEVLAENALTNSYESLREITGQEHKDLNILDTGRFTASPTTVPAESLIDEAKTKNLTLLSSRILQDIARDNISLA